MRFANPAGLEGKGEGGTRKASWRREGVLLATHMRWILTPPHLLHVGGWLHGTRGGRGGPEAGADQGRETRAQLHDGHSAHQAGKDTSPIMAISPPGPQG